MNHNRWKISSTNTAAFGRPIWDIDTSIRPIWKTLESTWTQMNELAYDLKKVSNIYNGLSGPYARDAKVIGKKLSEGIKALENLTDETFNILISLEDDFVEKYGSPDKLK